MYQLMRQRHGLSSATEESDDEADGLQAFLDDFELQKPSVVVLSSQRRANTGSQRGENGFIEHHVERLLETARDSPISSALTVRTRITTNSRTSSRKSEPLDDDALSGDEEAEGSDEDRDELDLLDRHSKAADDVEASRSQSPKSAKGEEAQEDGGAEVHDSMKEEEEAMDLDARSPEPSELGYPESPVKGQASKETLSTSVSRPLQATQPSSIEPLPATPNAQAVQTAGDTANQASTAHGENPHQPERPALKVTPSEPCVNPASLVKHHNSIVIPAPLEPSISSDQFNNTAIAPFPPHGPTAVPTTTSVLQYKMEYPLPHSSILPPEFNRKKTSKRKKDRSDKKGDDLPMGLNRWAATLTANPVYHRLRRSTKCLSTKDWTVRSSHLSSKRSVETKCAGRYRRTETHSND